MDQAYLAIDLGAESGRGIVYSFDGDRLRAREVGRFTTGRGEADIDGEGVARWNIEALQAGVDGLLTEALAITSGRLAGVGVDTWAVDFGLIGADGKLLEAPVCYRDRAHADAMSRVHSRVSPLAMWDATGIRSMAFNTVYQLDAVANRNPALLDRAKRLLFMPDLLHHHLTGGAVTVNERTNASTSQMMQPGGGWDFPLLAEAGLPSHFLGNVAEPGTRCGVTVNGGVPVFLPPTHDTASAVAAVPASTANWAFLSSGTWSLLGAECSEPAMSRRAMRLDFSNEAGVGGTTRLLKNIMGLWLVQECRRCIRRHSGSDLGYEELMALAKAAPEDGPVIDAVDGRFLNPADMASEIRAACRETGQMPPDDSGALIRCCLESLALAYRRGIRDLENLLGRRFEAIHVIGGGCKNTLLNQWTADACGLPVCAGPAEASALGNALGQMVGAGVLETWSDARSLARRSVEVETYAPDPRRRELWEKRDSAMAQLWGSVDAGLLRS